MFPPQIVLTKVDIVEKQVKSKYGFKEAELRLREQLDYKIDGIAMKLGVSRSSIHFIENYHESCDKI